MSQAIFEGNINQLFAQYDTVVKSDIVKIRAYGFTFTVNMALVKATVLEDRVITFLFTDGSRLRVYRSGVVAYREPKSTDEKPLAPHSQR